MFALEGRCVYEGETRVVDDATPCTPHSLREMAARLQGAHTGVSCHAECSGSGDNCVVIHSYLSYGEREMAQHSSTKALEFHAAPTDQSHSLPPYFNEALEDTERLLNQPA